MFSDLILILWLHVCRPIFQKTVDPDNQHVYARFYPSLLIECACAYHATLGFNLHCNFGRSKHAAPSLIVSGVYYLYHLPSKTSQARSCHLPLFLFAWSKATRLTSEPLNPVLLPSYWVSIAYVRLQIHLRRRTPAWSNRKKRRTRAQALIRKISPRFSARTAECGKGGYVAHRRNHAGYSVYGGMGLPSV
jgi:hypothetical protein